MSERTEAGAGYRGHLAIYLKGLFMGAADAVPGVSGGTIALIVGVYERLIGALTALDPRALLLLRDVHTSEGRREFRQALVRMDVLFLALLGLGVLTAAAAVSGVMHFAVVNHPVATYSFFFGLIGASAVILRDEVRFDSAGRVGAGVAGFALAFLVSGITQGSGGAGLPNTLPVIFLTGAVAITAMILPGVSGAFILVLLGKYEFMTELPADLLAGGRAALAGDLGPIVDPLTIFLTFAVGAVVGLLTVAHLVRFALEHWRRATLTFLVALMVGALRAPYIQIRGNVGAVDAAAAATVVVPLVVGAALVLGLDHVTDDIDY